MPTRELACCITWAQSLGWQHSPLPARPGIGAGFWLRRLPAMLSPGSATSSSSTTGPRPLGIRGGRSLATSVCLVCFCRGGSIGSSGEKNDDGAVNRKRRGEHRDPRRLRRHHDDARDELDQQFLEGAGQSPADLAAYLGE